MRSLSSVLLMAFCFHSFAQSPTKSVETSRQLKITYIAPAWNLASEKIDTAYVILRDKNTGKIVHIQLEETEPDSAEFSGTFSVSMGDADHISPEIFVPPTQQALKDKDYKKLLDSIQSGALQRKPIVTVTNERGQSVVEVFDTREKAEEGLRVYQEKQKLAQDQRVRKTVKPLPNEASMAAAKLAEHKAIIEKMANETATREAQRIRMEQIEKQKAEEAARRAKELTEAERAQRKAEGVKIAAEADKLYAAGDYPNAESKYRKAAELDPDNKSYYFKYGVSLYRNGKFNEALVALKLAELTGKSDLERKYFMGLCHYRLGELDPAIQSFTEVAGSKDPEMAPSSLFYVGVVQYSKENYEESKKAFETVIDTSNDPKIDQQAEDYLDKIAAQLMYKKMRENKWNVSGTVGLMYDSNVLLSPDNAGDQGQKTNSADSRLVTIGEVDYRPIFNEHHEWSANLSANLTNSAKNDSAKADPFIYDFALPYTYKGTVWTKGYRMTAKPMYEMLYMDPTGTGTKSDILSSYVLDLDNTFIMNADWFSTYSLEYRMDDSKTADSIPGSPADADAAKYSLRTMQSLFLDKGKKEAVMGNLGYVINAAKGSEKKYHRYELGATYVRPIPWGSSFNCNLAAYQLTYQTKDPVQKDTNITLTVGATKPIREWVTWGLTGSYSKNNSTDTASAYSKYTVMTTANFNTSF